MPASQANPQAARRRPSTAEELASLEHSLSPKRKSLSASSAIAAVLLFTVCNILLWAVYSDNGQVKGSASDSNRDLWSGAGSIDITVNHFRALKQAPTVVLLGSSLIMHPFWSMDAELGNVGDIFHHHQSLVLTHDLGLSGIQKPLVYSFAVFGEMISDAYIYVNDFLKDDMSPRLVMFGIAPRDFSDADLPSPTASFTFKRLVGLKNFSRYAGDYMPGWQERGEFVAAHTCYFYGKRWRLQHEFLKATDRILARCGIKCNAADVKDEPAQKGGFLSGKTREERFELSAKEYARRYKGIGDKDLSLQMSFLNKILSTCHERGIKVLLVNMPLTRTNLALLPPDFYESYRRSIAEVAKSKGTEFIDLGDSPVFRDHDFWDTAHLNNLGGHKLLGCIEPSIKKSLATPIAQK